MWSRITTLPKKVHAETVVFRLDNHVSRIKDKIMTQIGDKLKGNEDGITELIKFLDTIYNKDEMADAWDKYIEFTSVTKKRDQCMTDFISEWTNVYHKAKKVGCVYSDVILAFKILQDSKLEDIDVKLVLTGVDYIKGKANKDLFDQVVTSLKKFQGRNIMSSEDRKLDVKVEPTWLAEAQDVFLAKGWKPPKKGERRR